MGYPESNFTSLHQPGGLKVNWPVGRTSYRSTVMAQLSKFKFWIPAGTKDVSVLFHVGQGQLLENWYIARLGKPPDAIEFKASAVTGGFKLAALSAKDCFGVGTGGYVQVVADTQPNVTTGQWLYVHVVKCQGGIQDIQGRIMVDAAKYKAWYSTAKWLTNGDPGAGSVVPVVDPVPVIVDIVISSAQWKAIQSGGKINWIVK